MKKKYLEEVAEIKNVEVPLLEAEQAIPQKSGRKPILFFALLILAVAGLCGTFYYYRQYEALSISPDAEAQKQSIALITTLGKLIELPEGETPTIATISDLTKLKDQAFFSQAQNGDILFAYTTAMKAILYRPSTNKIINVAPININQPQDLTQGTKK